MSFELIYGLITGVLIMELYNHFYAKGDRKKIGYALIAGVIATVIWFIWVYI